MALHLFSPGRRALRALDPGQKIWTKKGRSFGHRKSYALPCSRSLRSRELPASFAPPPFIRQESKALLNLGSLSLAETPETATAQHRPATAPRPHRRAAAAIDTEYPILTHNQ